MYQEIAPGGHAYSCLDLGLRRRHTRTRLLLPRTGLIAPRQTTRPRIVQIEIKPAALPCYPIQHSTLLTPHTNAHNLCPSLTTTS